MEKEESTLLEFVTGKGASNVGMKKKRNLRYSGSSQEKNK